MFESKRLSGYALIVMSVISLGCTAGFSQNVIQRSGESSTVAIQGSSSKRITIESDGWQLVGDLQIPVLKGRRAPVVVMLHKANGSRAAYIALAQLLAQKGIASLRLDLRAHGESTNKGKFGPPFDESMRQFLIGSNLDVTAAIDFLKTVKDIDARRIAFVGASFSGEQMAIAARKSGYGKAYVALSPGSFSNESINAIDKSGAAWLFVRSADEKNLKGMHEDIRKVSKLAEFIELTGDKHATDIFDSHPELNETIADWLRRKL
jgi:dienelactone hydrolase